MDEYMGMAAIIGVCLLVLIIVTAGRKVEWVVNLVLRAVLGAVGIYFVNIVLVKQQIPVMLGVNPITILTTGFLGLPGLLALYGIQIYKMI